MSKGQTNIIGLTPSWREGKAFDAYRLMVFKQDRKFWISPKIHPTMKEIHEYLKQNNLKKETAERDPKFIILTQRLHQEIKDEHGLKEYRCRELVDFKKKEFDFNISLDEFEKDKQDTSVPHTYRNVLEKFWFPYFAQFCTHPNQFIKYEYDALEHLKTAKKTNSEETYSIHSLPSMASALNEYMRFLKRKKYIERDALFALDLRITLEQKKKGLNSHSRTKDTYTLEELISIKERIDFRYGDDLLWKCRAYAMYFGVCTGLRRGNILGLKPKNLHPKEKIPYFETNDNVVSGWSRGIAGKAILSLATKAFVGSVGLPLLQPSREILIEVALCLKDNLPANEYILQCHPDTVDKWWEKVADDCNFKYLNPHAWKHTYATIGAAHLEKWYKNNPYNLQVCCLHEKIETTNKYIYRHKKQFLNNFYSEDED